MESRLKILGHPVHPMLVTLPLGLFVTAVVFDLGDLAGAPALLGEVAYWNIAAGLVGGALAALAGLVDLLSTPFRTRAGRVGLAHALVNAGVLVLFASVGLARMGSERHGAGWLFAVELVALAGGGVGAWLGSELVDRLGVGVDPEANLDAPASLHTGLLFRGGQATR